MKNILRYAKIQHHKYIWKKDNSLMDRANHYLFIFYFVGTNHYLFIFYFVGLSLKAITSNVEICHGG
jgi:hypothetical protein